MCLKVIDSPHRQIDEGEQKNVGADGALVALEGASHAAHLLERRSIDYTVEAGQYASGLRFGDPHVVALLEVSTASSVCSAAAAEALPPASLTIR